MGRKMKNGLYLSKPRPGSGQTATYLFQIRVNGVPYNGNTGQTTRAGAKTWLDKYRENLAKHGVGLIDPKVIPTLDVALGEWCKRKKHQVTDAHINNVRVSITTHCKKYLFTRISELTNDVIEDIRSLYLSITGSGHNGAKLSHGPGGANTVIKYLKSIIKSNVSRTIYDNRPLERMPFDVSDLRSQAILKGILWLEQWIEFLLNVRKSRNPHAYASVYMMLSLGLREDEALSARWEALLWRNHTYTVAGDPSQDISTKSRGLRTLRLPPKLEQHLRAIWVRAGEPTRGLISPNSKGKKHSPGYTRKPIARSAKAMGLNHIHPHVLRSSFATALYEKNVPIRVIRDLLGHADEETTKIYIVKRPQALIKAQELVVYKSVCKSGLRVC